MIKRGFFFFTVFLILASFLFPLQAEEKKVKVYFFWAKGCPHCAAEEKLLEKLGEQYPLEIESFEVSQNRDNAALLGKVGEKLGADIPGVPLTVIGEKYIVGYRDEETSGSQIKEAIICNMETGCSDLVEDLLVPRKKETVETKTVPETINLPLLGKIKTKNLSLPLLTIAIGLLDGFNPCAMWALLFLISLLLGMKDRKRMWLLGIAFILTSGLVYFLIMTAWLNLFLVLGFVFWIRIMVALAALFAGGYNLRQYWRNRDGGCPATGEEKRRRVFEKLKQISQRREIWFALAGIIALAVAVNLIELVCSAGLPAVYTQILALNQLPAWQYYLYILLYILFFMIDDLIVFILAMVTLHAVGLESKYARYSHLIGGVLMVIIGFLLLFRPQLLMFG